MGKAWKSLMDGDGFIILHLWFLSKKKKKERKSTWHYPDSTGIVADDLFLQQKAKNRIIGRIKKKTSLTTECGPKLLLPWWREKFASSLGNVFPLNDGMMSHCEEIIAFPLAVSCTGLFWPQLVPIKWLVLMQLLKYDWNVNPGRRKETIMWDR